MSFTLILSQIILPALAACWQWFNSMWDVFNGFAGFFIAIFTMICAIRFFLMPFIGYHRTYARSSAEERPNNYNPVGISYGTSEYYSWLNRRNGY